VVQLEENYRVLIIDHTIQYGKFNRTDFHEHVRRQMCHPTALERYHLYHVGRYEMMTHLPMCSVQVEPSYILILNTDTRGGTNTVMTGYGILQQLLTCYPALLYKIVVVEHDPVVVQVWNDYFQNDHSGNMGLDDARVTVILSNPNTYLYDHADTIQGRYHVIFITNDLYDCHYDDVSQQVSHHDTTTTTSLDSTHHAVDHRTMLHQALVPGGVACMCTTGTATDDDTTTDHSSMWSNYNTTATNHQSTIEYAKFPTTTTIQDGGSHMLLRLYIRESNVMDHGRSTCRIPVRQPLLPNNNNYNSDNDHSLYWYSSEIHPTAFILPPYLLYNLHGRSTVETGLHAEMKHTHRNQDPQSLSSQRNTNRNHLEDTNDDELPNGNGSDCWNGNNVSIALRCLQRPFTTTTKEYAHLLTGWSLREKNNNAVIAVRNGSTDQNDQLGERTCCSIVPRPHCTIQ
jgi:hypothetical protein